MADLRSVIAHEMAKAKEDLGKVRAAEPDLAQLQDMTGAARPIGPEERHARLIKAQALMKANGIGAVLIEPWGEPRRLDLTASRRLALAAEGAYDGVVFHRVIDGFMAQTGDVASGNNLRVAQRLQVFVDPHKTLRIEGQPGALPGVGR